jgi:hypothetical protein
MTDSQLHLIHSFALLGLHRNGQLAISAPAFDCGLAGALLAELVAAGRIGLKDGRVVVLDDRPLGAALPDRALERIKAEGKPRYPVWWVLRLGSVGLREAVLRELMQQGEVRAEEVRVLGIFPSERFPEVDPAPERRLRTRLGAVLDGTGEPAPGDATLVALCRATGLLHRELDNTPKERVTELAIGNWTTVAVYRAIEELSYVWVG